MRKSSMQEMGYSHPSEFFQNGDVTNFHDAMEVYVAQCRKEVTDSPKYNIKITDGMSDNERRTAHARNVVENKEIEDGFTHTQEMVALATKIYDDIVGKAIKDAAAEMRKQGDILVDFAETLESGEYDSLAI